jgi:hypothetical protein
MLRRTMSTLSLDLPSLQSSRRVGPLLLPALAFVFAADDGLPDPPPEKLRTK